MRILYRNAFSWLSPFLVAILSFANCLAQAPQFSYKSLNNFSIGAPITPITPDIITQVGTGNYGISNILPFSYLSANTGIYNRFLTSDPSGNVYITYTGSSATNFLTTIQKIPAGNGPPKTIATGLFTINAMVANEAGDLYFSDSKGQVQKLVAGASAPVVIATGFNYATALALDPAGNIYVADTGNFQTYVANQGTYKFAVYKIAAVGFAKSVFYDMGGRQPWKLAIDNLGNVYILDTVSRLIVLSSTGTSASTSTVKIKYQSNYGDFSAPTNVVVDPEGSVYLTFSSGNYFGHTGVCEVVKYPVGGGEATIIQYISGNIEGYVDRWAVQY